eukprot:TRINITY_DN60748_c0_g1_i1.p1 TRINITY_DN60748_c0_g1~~TRINITY_DN60748_c0_g1_i1.p1  ORF type:complete len:660 (-),score=76.10 TRINITY_DN60748_c0_g1_i1:31-2010(-)
MHVDCSGLSDVELEGCPTNLAAFESRLGALLKVHFSDLRSRIDELVVRQGSVPLNLSSPYPSSLHAPWDSELSTHGSATCAAPRKSASKLDVTKRSGKSVRHARQSLARPSVFSSISSRKSIAATDSHIDILSFTSTVRHSIGKYLAHSRHKATVTSGQLEREDAGGRWMQLRVALRQIPVDLISGFTILLFALLLGLETDYMSRHSGDSSYLFERFYMAFNIYFIVELFLLLVVLGSQFIYGDDVLWNLFDLLMTLMSLAEILLVILETREGSSRSSSSVRALKALRVLRVIRTCRIGRMFRYVHEFKKMVVSLQASMMTLFWCLLLIFSMVYLVAIFIVQGATDYRISVVDTNDSSVAVAALLQLHFGNVPICIYTLYASITGGVNWGTVLEPLLSLSWIYTVIFLAFISVSIFGLLNVLTSVFVESTMRSAKYFKELFIRDAAAEKETGIRHLTNLFRLMDTDDDGVISVVEMKRHLDCNEDCNGYLEACDICPHDVLVLFRLLDREGSGSITEEDFCDGCLRLKGSAKSYDIHCIIYEQTRFLEQWSKFAADVVKSLSEINGHQKSIRSLQDAVDWQNKNISCLVASTQQVHRLLDHVRVSDEVSRKLSRCIQPAEVHLSFEDLILPECPCGLPLPAPLPERRCGDPVPSSLIAL